MSISNSLYPGYSVRDENDRSTEEIEAPKNRESGSITLHLPQNKAKFVDLSNTFSHNQPINIVKSTGQTSLNFISEDPSVIHQPKRRNKKHILLDPMQTTAVSQMMTKKISPVQNKNSLDLESQEMPIPDFETIDDFPVEEASLKFKLFD